MPAEPLHRRLTRPRARDPGPVAAKLVEVCVLNTLQGANGQCQCRVSNVQRFQFLKGALDSHSAQVERRLLDRTAFCAWVLFALLPRDAGSNFTTLRFRWCDTNPALFFLSVH